MPGAWFTASVCMDLMKHSRSAIAAVWGMKRLTHAPLWPCWAKGSTGSSMSLPLGAPVMVLKRLPATYSSGTGLPWSSCKRGL